MKKQQNKKYLFKYSNKRLKTIIKSAQFQGKLIVDMDCDEIHKTNNFEENLTISTQ